MGIAIPCSSTDTKMSKVLPRSQSESLPIFIRKISSGSEFEETQKEAIGFEILLHGCQQIAKISSDASFHWPKEKTTEPHFK